VVTERSQEPGESPGSAEAHAQTAHARLTVPSPRVVTVSHYPDGSEEIVVGSEAFRASSNGQRQDFQGRAAQGEEDVLQVCRSLRAALEREGERWGRFLLPTTPTDDVDAIATNDAGEVLQVQVTQVERAAWKLLAPDRPASLQRNVDELVAAIRAAVDAKGDPSPQRRKGIPRAQRKRLLLALDAIRSPGYVHDLVVAAFLDQHGEWAVGLGFRAIWLVGPTAELTRRVA
jgi:hypothetical protein